MDGEKSCDLNRIYRYFKYHNPSRHYLAICKNHDVQSFTADLALTA